ncbi:hypothetical protein [Nitrosomonas sp. Is37]|uniref:hypothetical protein n=1 Tax=Nitrosomonas sp. Is37 TaxID=3080535 RepID=UPI00398298C0
MSDVSAHYRLLPDDNVRVSAGDMMSSKGTWREAVGLAKFKGEPDRGFPQGIVLWSLLRRLSHRCTR